ncbi:MAG: hypothetical protein LC623_08900 [Halobacteriales archaeon]|nr:hypothetical protein [Halobacteriales archaeon]
MATARLVVSLLGLAVLFAVFAGTYYAPENLRTKTAAPSFQVAPGDNAQVRLLPTTAGTPIAVQIHAVGGPIDVYVLEKEWADRLAQQGELNLTQPFSFDAGPSRANVTGSYEFALVSDGRTEHLLVLDNGGDFYRGGAVPDLRSPTNGTVSVELTIHYLQEEERSIWFAYLAATPGVALVVFTIGHRVWRTRRAKP